MGFGFVGDSPRVHGIKRSAAQVATRTAKSARYMTRMRLGAGPHSVQTLTWWRRSWRQSIARPGIATCIDGFPRSANTYAEMVFQLRNGPVPFAHHMHVPGQILRAVRLEIPCAVLIRSPVDAISSMLLVDGQLPVGFAIWSYIDFYRRTWSVRSSVAVCPFDEVVADGSIVSRRLNEVFGTNFDDRPVEPAERDQIFAELEELQRALPSPWLPATPDRSREKAARKLEIAAALHRSPRLREAEEWHARWLEVGDEHAKHGAEAASAGLAAPDPASRRHQPAERMW